MNRLLAVVPSRSRPADVARLIAAVKSTATLTEVAFGFDADDPELEASVAAAREAAFASVRIGPRQSQTAWANAIAVPAAGRFQAVALLSDDNVPLTPGWDDRMLAVLSEPGVFMTAAEDLSGNSGRPSHIAMSSRAVRALGWIAEPSMRHYCIDNVWEELGRRTGGYRFLPDVIIDHVWRPGRAPEDQLRREELDRLSEDQQAFIAWLAERSREDAEKLNALWAPQDLLDFYARPAIKG